MKKITNILILNWGQIFHLEEPVNNSTLILGENGSGKSSYIDALAFLLTGEHKKFNSAAVNELKKNSQRSLYAYMTGDTQASDNKNRFLRNRENVHSYIVIEIYSEDKKQTSVIGVHLELTNGNKDKIQNTWFIAQNTNIKEFNFYAYKNNKLQVNPYNIAIMGKKNLIQYSSVGTAIKQVQAFFGLRTINDSVRRNYNNNFHKCISSKMDGNINEYIKTQLFEAFEDKNYEMIKKLKKEYDKLKLSIDHEIKKGQSAMKIVNSYKKYNSYKKDYTFIPFFMTYMNIIEYIEKLENSKKELNNLNSESNIIDKEFEIVNDKIKSIEKILYSLENNKNMLDFKDVINSIELQKKENNIKHKEAINMYDKTKSFINLLLNIVHKYNISIDNEIIDDIINWDNNKQNVSLISQQLNKAIDEIKNKNELYNEELYDLKNKNRNLNDEILELRKKQEQLENNQYYFPKDFDNKKNLLKNKLEKCGINTEIKFFVEYIYNIKDESWRNILETYLGNQRFDILIEPKYLTTAVNIIRNDSKLTGLTVVNIDAIKNISISPNSAATLLEIYDAKARKYADYLLGKMILCDTDEDIIDNSKAGLSKDGIIAKGARIKKLQFTKNHYIGQDSIVKMLKETKKEINNKINKKEEYEQEIKRVRKTIEEIKILVNNLNYDINSYNTLKNIEDIIEKLNNQLEKYNKNVDFAKYLQELEITKKEREKLVDEKDNIMRKQAKNQTRISDINDTIEEYELLLKTEEENKIELEKTQLDLSIEAKEVFKKQNFENINKVERYKASLEGRIEASEQDLYALEDDFEENFNKNSLGIRQNHEYYVKLHDDIIKYNLPKSKNKLKENENELVNGLIKDFINIIGDNIQNAKDKAKDISNTLKKYPFGNDTYSFIVKENKEDEVAVAFYNLYDKISNFNDFMNGINNNISDQEYLDFINLFDETNNKIWTDYRNYLKYDVEIKSKDKTFLLSTKQGNASGGERQTSFTLILVAACLNYYSTNTECAKILIFDEAFEKLSDERIKMMIKYLDDNNIQAFFAAPDSKKESIGNYVNTITSLSRRGVATEAATDAEKIKKIY